MFKNVSLSERLSCLKTLPVPAVQVGYDGEIISVSPVALVNWVSSIIDQESDHTQLVLYLYCRKSCSWNRTQIPTTSSTSPSRRNL